jgi:glycosyltransferase involved in cell wall biosynthesis
MKVSIIIPAYNEAKTIEKILSLVLKAKLPKGIEKEIIVVDDGSVDGTVEILKRKFHNPGKIKLFLHKRNRGKGAAIRTGFKRATGDILLIQDADLEYNPLYYQKLLEPIINGKAEVVYGSRLKNLRFKPWGKNRTPLPLHFLGNKFLTAMTNFLYKGKITDMETGYKVFTRKVIDGIKLKANRFDFEPEITAKILKKGIDIKEIPIKTKIRGYSEGKKITWKDGFNALFVLFKYRLTD